jgi:CRP-like cAMP-binding protein
MTNHYFDQMIRMLRKEPWTWAQFRAKLVESEIPARSTLLYEGEVADRIHFIRKGCLRLWFNKDGKDITVQFFFEGQAVASIDSMMSGEPSLFNIESIEPTALFSIGREDFEQICNSCPEFREGFRDLLFQRFRNYARLFLSRIKDSPAERYDDLLKNHPEIILRVPQHYIASYLGITPVSLSRIRSRRTPFS